MNLNYHNAAVKREIAANLLCTKYSSILQYVKSALLSRAFAIDQEAYSILIKNRITDLPDRRGIPLDQILLTFGATMELPTKRLKPNGKQFLTPHKI